MQVNFNNKVVIVTGSNAGNGFAIAKAYSNLNAKVIRVDKNFTSKLKTIDIKFKILNRRKFFLIDLSLVPLGINPLA